MGSILNKSGLRKIQFGSGEREVSIMLLTVSVGKIRLQSCEQVMVIELSGVPQASNFISH